MVRPAIVVLLSVAQAAAAAQKPALALELQVKDPLDGVPQRIRLTLRNLTDHDLRIPEPGITCTGLYGSLRLHVTHSPARTEDATAKPARPCPVQPENENPRKWITLGSGGYLDRWYSATQLQVRDQGAGRYDLQAEYRPPALSPTLARSLAEEGILYPHAAVRSAHILLKK